MTVIKGFVAAAAYDVTQNIGNDKLEALGVAFLTSVVFPAVLDALKNWFKKRKERKELGHLKQYVTGEEGR